MGQFIAKHLTYPEKAKAKKIEGTVVLWIDINYKGVVLGSKVRSSLGHGCDEEAQRVVKLLKFDVPNAVRRGKVLFHKTINIRFNLPVEKPKPTPTQTQSTKLTYSIVKKKKEKASSSYNYTINLG